MTLTYYPVQRRYFLNENHTPQLVVRRNSLDVKTQVDLGKGRQCKGQPRNPGGRKKKPHHRHKMFPLPSLKRKTRRHTRLQYIRWNLIVEHDNVLPVGNKKRLFIMSWMRHEAMSHEDSGRRIACSLVIPDTDREVSDLRETPIQEPEFFCVWMSDQVRHDE